MAEAALSPLSRLYKATPVLLVAGLTLIWASRPTIPVVARGMGVMAPPGDRRGIYARGPGEVQQLEVRVGDQVRSGQRLLTLSQVGQSAPGGGGEPLCGQHRQQSAVHSGRTLGAEQPAPCPGGRPPGSAETNRRVIRRGCCSHRSS